MNSFQLCLNDPLTAAEWTELCSERWWWLAGPEDNVMTLGETDGIPLRSYQLMRMPVDQQSMEACGEIRFRIESDEARVIDVVRAVCGRLLITLIANPRAVAYLTKLSMTSHK